MLSTNNEPEVLRKRPPARSFADLQGGAPPEPTTDGGAAFIITTPPSETEPVPQEAHPGSASHAYSVDGLRHETRQRFGMLEARVETLEAVAREAEDPSGSEAREAFVVHLLRLVVQDQLVSPTAAMLALAREYNVTARDPETWRDDEPPTVAAQRRQARPRTPEEDEPVPPVLDPQKAPRGRPAKAKAKATPSGDRDAFRARCAELGLSQAQIAKAGKLPPSQISRWLVTGSGSPELVKRAHDALEKLAKKR